MQTVILTLIVVDLFALGMSYHTTVPAETIFPETPILSLVKSDRSIFRVVGTSTDFMPNTAMAHDLYDVRGLVFPERRYRELCQAMGGEDWVGIGILFPNDLPSRFLDLLNVKYVLTSSALGPDVLRNLSLVDRDGDIRLYESLSYLPRAFVVHRVRVGEDDQEILGMLRDHEFDMGAEIVLEKPPPAGFAGSIAAPQGTAEITRYEPNHVTIVASTATDGFLFLSESYDAGWRVYVDGLESEVYRADYAFRAVYLTAGEHQVEWIYTPRSFQLGLVVSLMAAFCVIFLLAGKRP